MGRGCDHFAAYRLDPHGNPVGDPHRFAYDLSGTNTHRDAQIRHALTRLLHWAGQTGLTAIGIEDLVFTAEKTREKHGRRKQFRRLISGMPTGKLKARPVSIATEQGLAIVAVDPAYTSMEAGARGHLTKDARGEEIVQAIEAVMSGQAGLAPTVQCRLLDRVTAQSGRGSRTPRRHLRPSCPTGSHPGRPKCSS